jgi:cytochrome oxidase Cu insertion factor (SCO1/SenC/PrrC family)
LALGANVLAAALAALSAATYLFLYTPLKRRTALCTLAGAIPGALPPVIGWAAARQAVSLEAWALFWLLFVWQLPHFLALATLYRDDYARAGLRVLPVTEVDGMITSRQLVLYGAALVPISLFPSVIGMGGSWYFSGALLISLAFLALAIRAAVLHSSSTARWLFGSSLLYLPVLLGLLVCDRGPSLAAASATRAVASPLAPADPTPAARALPEFSLVDHEGRPFTRQTLAGRVWIADFIFTRCAGQCPLMHEAMQRLTRHPTLQLVSFTVDPAFDTVERLGVFARDVGAPPGRWRFVTGERPALWALARDGFKLGVGEDGSSIEPITHSVRLVLVDQAGRIRGYYNATDAEAMRQLEQHARALLQPHG